MAPQIFTHVLVGWDDSTGSAAALKLALRLTAVEGGQLTALAVVPGFAHVEDVDGRARAINEVRIPLRADYDSIVDDVGLAPGQSESLEFAETVDVANAFNRYVASHPIDAVVIGLHGRDGLLHPKMGHIANQAVRTLRCPVVVVPEPGDAAAYPLDEQTSSSKLSGLFHPFRHHGNAET